MWSALRDCSNVEIHLRDDKIVSGIVKDVQREYTVLSNEGKSVIVPYQNILFIVVN